LRTITAGLMVSVDGVVEAPETWTGPYFGPAVGQVVGSLMAASDTMLLGRVTYQTFEGAFSHASDENPMAAQMNNIAKVVVSTTLASADWANSALIRSDVRDQVAALKAAPGRDIIVSGSPTLVRWLLLEGLLDQLDLLIFPVIQGNGRHLFEGFGGTRPLTLATSEALDKGVLHATYRAS
jgi:dihydrofolate reductase